jgi:predicted XRE-type DNA-binding protein
MPALVSTTIRIALDTWVTQWLAERDLRPSALATYQKVLRPLLTDLGHVKLSQAQPDDAGPDLLPPP